MQVSQELLHLVYGDLPGIEQDRGYRMPEQMRRACRFQLQAAPDPFHNVFGLIVAEMMPAPKAEGFLDDLAKRMRQLLFDHAICAWPSVSEWHALKPSCHCKQSLAGLKA